MSEINQFKKWFWFALVSWIFLVCMSFAWNARQSWQSMLDQGRSEGRMAFMKDLSYRLWHARHGGVYVPISDETQPNPYLKVPYRDVVTTEGKKLTLINPAYMTRLVFTMTEEIYGLKGHLTSLKLLNPGNAPDEWEKQGLTTFEEDPSEITEFMLMDGEPFLRFMRPLITEKACLECHGHMGYKEGDVRGGMSVSVPMSAHIADTKKIILHLAIAHLIFLLAGSGILLFSKKRVIEYFTVKKDAEKQANEERERLNVTLCSIGDGVITTDLNGKIVLINKITEQLTGWSQQEAIGRPVQEVFNIINEKTGKPCDNPVDKVLASGKIVALANHTALIARDGTQYIIEDSVAPMFDKESKMIGTVLVFRDVTERKKIKEEKRQLEAQLTQAQKMESVGRLAGGVAHDFNNILSIILGYSELIIMGMSADAPYRKDIEIILNAGEKAAALTRQLLAFSRKQVLEVKPVCVNTIINDLVKLLGKMLGEDIEIVIHANASSGVIDADQGQFEQVLMNLAVNARDAMPYGGRLIIETQDIILEKEYTKTHLESEPGSYIMLAVTDFGKGMSKDVLEHIFDPFFTTKERGKGTGLGLATVHGIVKQHNGQIYAYSEPDKGTTFKMYFPASSKTVKKYAVRKDVILPCGTETVLVVDDDSSIRKLIIDTIEPFGYKCLEASGGTDALKLTKTDPQLLLTDVIMPGMSGKELADIFKVKSPSTKVIFMSGFTDNAIAHYGVLEDGINFIQKPVFPSILLKKIRGVLDSNSP